MDHMCGCGGGASEKVPYPGGGSHVGRVSGDPYHMVTSRRQTDSKYCIRQTTYASSKYIVRQYNLKKIFAFESV